MKVLSGMRPTGRLHIGHLFGALTLWRELQERHNTYFFVADWHALTTDFKEPWKINENTVEMVADWLAAGIDPAKSLIYRQSLVKEHAELHLLLSMIVPLSWLERNPTYKEVLENLKKQSSSKYEEIRTYGFLGYPVLQTVDIIIYKAERVPVGADQLPHLELAREIVRRFNFLYGETFPEPQPLLTRFPKVPGIDGRKMSKSYNNAIYIADSPEEIRKKVSVMFTDPLRPYRKDPGHPDKCPVFALHSLVSPDEELAQLKEDCRSARVGCKECKLNLAEKLIEYLEPYRKRREAVLKDRDYIVGLLEEGSRKASEEASMTLEEARARMGMP